MGNFTHQVAAVLAGCLITAPLCAYEKQGLIVTLSQEEDDACKEGDGCILVPKAEAERALQFNYETGLKACHGRDRL